VPGKLFIECAVVLRRQSKPAIFRRKANPRKASVEKLALQRAVTGHGLQFFLVIFAMLAQIPWLYRTKVVLDPFARAQAKVLYRFGLLAHAACSFAICMAASHRR